MGISIKNDLNEEHFKGDIVDISDHDEGFFEQCQGSEVDLAIIILPDTGGSGSLYFIKLITKICLFRGLCLGKALG